MRTDSPRVAAEAQAEARDAIAARYGPTRSRPATVLPGPKSAQEAHEAIRPTLLDHPPERLARHLSRDQLALYRLIWERFLAARCGPPSTTPDGGRDGRAIPLPRAGLRASLPGFMAVYIEAPDESAAAPRRSSPRCRACRPSRSGSGSLVRSSRSSTSLPPPRYTEASLVKELEEKGIGRPSTYAQILTTIQKREYVQKDRGSLSPTELGETVTDLLVKSFPDIFEVAFTAQMEESLDEIEEGPQVGRHRSPVLRTLRGGPQAGRLRDGGLKNKVTDETCPTCGEGKLLEKWGRFGRSWRASGTRTASTRGTRGQRPGGARAGRRDLRQVRPPMVYKQSRFGRFIGCSGYPECKNIKKITLGIACPQEGCGGS